MSDPNRSARSVSSEKTERPWQDETVLRSLYCDQECSLRETADELGCSPETVRRWLHRYDIGTRPAHDQKIHPCYEVNQEGYAYFKSKYCGEEDRLARHELAAIAKGADPHKVFSEDTHCHHHLRVPSNFEGAMQLDLPANIEVMDAHEHLSAHQEGDLEVPTPEEILTSTDVSTESRQLSAD